MTDICKISAVETDIEAMTTHEGAIAVFTDETGKMDKAIKRLNRLTKGSLVRFLESEDFANMPTSSVQKIEYPTGMKAAAILVAKMDGGKKSDAAVRVGAKIAAASSGACLMYSVARGDAAALCEGFALRGYSYTAMKSEDNFQAQDLCVHTNDPDGVSAALNTVRAVANGVFFTRDLVNAPANVLTTTQFANELADLSDLGLKVEVLEEDALEELGMRTLLSVGQGSDSPSKVVVMEWQGGGDEAPLALIGKGVVFDTGGISLKPAGGMEDMTMDMGGAGVVAGVMKTLAMRKANANVVGIVGLVENMPSGNATRPGDVVKSMKGDTVEIINTDAEGRLVLADVLWYAQEKFKPSGMIDLATLTGAIIIGLGHDNAGVFSNDDAFCNQLLKSAGKVEEGAWRMPMGKSYDDQLKSNIADMKNVGGRPAGSITAAQFLQRFVKDGVPWAHIDIAGVASLKTASAFAPKGATGWGVRALNQLVADHYEGDA